MPVELSSEGDKTMKLMFDDILLMRILCAPVEFSVVQLVD